MPQAIHITSIDHICRQSFCADGIQHVSFCSGAAILCCQINRSVLCQLFIEEQLVPVAQDDLFLSL